MGNVITRRGFIGTASMGALAGCRLPPPRMREADIVVYGGTAAAVVAAVQAAKMGKSVIVVGPDRHLGGLTSGGLGFTDAGNTRAIGGLAREFYERVYRYYSDASAWRWQRIEDFKNVGQGSRARVDSERAMWTFEPHVAEAIFETWVAEHQVPVYRNEWLDRARGVEKRDGRIVAITMLGVKTKGPYKIAYGSIIPKANECVNLLVPVCVSSSHIAFGSIRMEPVFMILGQSAATAAAQAIDEGRGVQAIDRARLRTRLLADGQRL